MPGREVHNTIEPAVGFKTQVISSDTTTEGEIIDTQGFDAIEYVIQSGTITLGTITPVLEEGDESDLSDASDVADADLTNTEASAAFAATDDDVTKRIGYIGGKRYLRLKLTTAASANLTVGSTVLKALPNNAPVAANA